jgi:hypothetical protein
MLSVIMQSVVMLCRIMLSLVTLIVIVIILSMTRLSVIILSVILQTVIRLIVIMLIVLAPASVWTPPLKSDICDEVERPLGCLQRPLVAKPAQCPIYFCQKHASLLQKAHNKPENYSNKPERKKIQNKSNTREKKLNKY